jgi:Ca2+-binding RTX toxin-like protein
MARIVGTNLPDKLFGTPSIDVILGGHGNDYLSGLSGNDLLISDFGDDRLFGGSGRDRLRGGPGEDVLQGGKGNDRLWGGPAFDIFKFKIGDGSDVIMDYGHDDIFDIPGPGGIFADVSLSTYTHPKWGYGTNVSYEGGHFFVKGASSFDFLDFI